MEENEFAAADNNQPAWRPIETAPKDGTRVLVDFMGAGPIVAFKPEPDEPCWVRYLGFGKSQFWPAVHEDYATGWLPLPASASSVGGSEYNTIQTLIDTGRVQP